jgi:hypothetical protein
MNAQILATTCQGRFIGRPPPSYRLVGPRSGALEAPGRQRPSGSAIYGDFTRLLEVHVAALDELQQQVSGLRERGWTLHARIRGGPAAEWERVLCVTIGAIPARQLGRLIVRCPVRILLFLALVVALGARADDTAVVTPACAHPARLEGHFDWAAPRIVFVLKPSTKDLGAVGTALSKKYGFKIVWWFTAVFKGFMTPYLAPSEIAELRCEADVELIEYDQRNSIS